MAAYTEFVDGFVELKTYVGGMGRVTDHTAAALNDPMGEETDGVFVGVFFIGMASHTEVGLAISPELEFVGITMGVVAYGAIPCTDWAVDMFLFLDLYLVHMALETDLFHSTGEHGDLGIAGPFAMAAHTVDIGYRTVEPLVLTVKFAVAGEADRGVVGIFLETLDVEPGILGELLTVAELACLGDYRRTVKEKCLGIFKVYIEQGPYRFIANLEFLFTGIDHETIAAPLEGQGVVYIGDSVLFITGQRFNDLFFPGTLLSGGHTYLREFGRVVDLKDQGGLGAAGLDDDWLVG